MRAGGGGLRVGDGGLRVGGGGLGIDAAVVVVVLEILLDVLRNVVLVAHSALHHVLEVGEMSRVLTAWVSFGLLVEI